MVLLMAQFGQYFIKQHYSIQQGQMGPNCVHGCIIVDPVDKIHLYSVISGGFLPSKIFLRFLSLDV